MVSKVNYTTLIIHYYYDYFTTQVQKGFVIYASDKQVCINHILKY